MSAPRPRPVTATVTRQEQKLTYRPTSRASLSSGSSVHSLVSGVDVSGSSQSSSIGSDVTPRSGGRDDGDAQRAPALGVELTVTGRESKASATKDLVSRLTPWESWLLKKARKEREMLKQKAQEQEHAQEEERKAITSKEEKLFKIERVLTEWRAKKDIERQRQSASDNAAKARVEAAERAKKEKIQQQASEKFQDWLNHKREEEKKRRDAEKERLRLEALKLDEKRRLGAEAFRQWAEAASARQHPMSCGDAGAPCNANNSNLLRAYPQPAFCNPVAWQPVCILSAEKAGNKKKSSAKVDAALKKLKRNPWSVENV